MIVFNILKPETRNQKPETRNQKQNITVKLPIICPSCENALNVSQMHCKQCETLVNGNYELPLYMKLSREEQEFILNFFISSGSIKEMAKQAEMSYPTMRNKMDDLIFKIRKMEVRNPRSEENK